MDFPIKLHEEVCLFCENSLEVDFPFRYEDGEKVFEI